jgi:predicted dithiol-disulfide oxidoreductase (DUF899 family)
LEPSLVSSAHTDFNFDLGFSRTEEQSREAVARMMAPALAAVGADAADERGVEPVDLVVERTSGLPPIVEQNARSTGTDVVGYLTESPGFSAFVRDDGTTYQVYSTTWRGLEFLMTYYPILDHPPKGRDEGDEWQLWIGRHDEYDSE